MGRYKAWRKWARGAAVLWGSFTLVFLIFTAVPDPARQLAGQQADPEVIADLRAQFGLDQPPWVRYVQALQALSPVGALEGGGWGLRWPSLGQSYVRPASVGSLLMQALPATCLLAFTALLFAVLAGLAHGAGCSQKSRRVV